MSFKDWLYNKIQYSNLFVYLAYREQDKTIIYKKSREIMAYWCIIYYKKHYTNEINVKKYIKHLNKLSSQMLGEISFYYEDNSLKELIKQAFIMGDLFSKDYSLSYNHMEKYLISLVKEKIQIKAMR